MTYLFKRKDLAEAFQKSAFNLGDVPQTPKSDMKLEFDFYNPDILQSATRSSKNTEMYVSSVSAFDTRWAITLTFFPVPAYTKSFESVKDLITQKLLKKKRDEAGQRWIKQQLANAKIENLLEDAIKILEQRSARW